MAWLFAGWAMIASAAAQDDLPVWINSEIESQSDRLAALYGLPRMPIMNLQYTAEGHTAGVRIIEAEAEADLIRVHFQGDWTQESDAARQDVVRNLAHELAHVRQYASGLPVEPRFWHEGFAEAMAIEALDQCGAPCGGAPAALLRSREQQCGEALRSGYLSGRTDNDAVYGCGAIFVLAVAKASDSSVIDLYGSFAATDRSEAAMLALVQERAGRPFGLSARRFLKSDYRLVPAPQTIRDLRRGKL
ncbi:MAG: hypothetical protein HRU11_07660 [Parvularculaceae bacterium]|nr:hypothetical protein [Parvularculaceae bacterium]